MSMLVCQDRSIDRSIYLSIYQAPAYNIANLPVDIGVAREDGDPSVWYTSRAK